MSKHYTEKISITWTAEDVRACAKNRLNKRLTRQQVSDVLNELKAGHNASAGINWDVIESTILCIL